MPCFVEPQTECGQLGAIDRFYDWASVAKVPPFRKRQTLAAFLTRCLSLIKVCTGQSLKVYVDQLTFWPRVSDIMISSALAPVAFGTTSAAPPISRLAAA
jgi:hypothetical protein